MKTVSELDEVVRLTTRRTWAMLLALVVVLGAATAWALLARVEETVTLDGVLLAGSGPSLVSAPAGGTVRAVLGRPGQQVRAGEALYVLDVTTEKPTTEKPTAEKVTTEKVTTEKASTGEATVESVTVVSPAAGVISGNRVVVGTAVVGGALLGTVDHVGAPLTAVLLLDVARGANVPAGTTVRGGAWTGTVVEVEPYPLPVNELAGRYGQSSLPGFAGNSQQLVRPVTVRLNAPSWPGATLTPVRFVLVLGSERPADLLLHGGS